MVSWFVDNILMTKMWISFPTSYLSMWTKTIMMHQLELWTLLPVQCFVDWNLHHWHFASCQLSFCSNAEVALCLHKTSPTNEDWYVTQQFQHRILIRMNFQQMRKLSERFSNIVFIMATLMKNLACNMTKWEKSVTFWGS